MSVKFTAVRFILAQQVDLWASSSGPRTTLCADAPSDLFHAYSLIEIVSTGWASGARCRTKRCSAKRAILYVNKLHAGHWIDDNEYGRAYRAIEMLLLKNGSWVPAEMGTPRYLLESELFDEGASSFIGVLTPPAHTGADSLDVCDKLSGVRL